MLQLQQILIFMFLKFGFGAPMNQFTATGTNSNPVMVKLDADEVLESLKVVLNSQFVKQIADDIAAKAVKHIVKEINQNEGGRILKSQIQQSLQSRPVKKAPKVKPVKFKLKSAQKYKTLEEVPTRKEEIKEVLDEKIALALLREPNPDGDNLQIDSLEFPTTVKAHVPMKINGKYMRRLFETLRAKDYLIESVDSAVEE